MSEIFPTIYLWENLRPICILSCPTIFGKISEKFFTVYLLKIDNFLGNLHFATPKREKNIVPVTIRIVIPIPRKNYCARDRLYCSEDYTDGRLCNICVWVTISIAFTSIQMITRTIIHSWNRNNNLYRNLYYVFAFE